MSERLTRIADHIWIYPRDEDPSRVQPNVGIIVTRHQTILVDGGNSPRHGRRIMIALDELQAPPVSHVICTHSHWDHVFGAMMFGAPLIAHELCRRQLAEMATRPWSHAYIQEEIQRMPSREAGLRALARAVEDFRNFRIALPEVVLTHTLRLYVEGLMISIEHVGGQHSPDSVVVRVPERRVLFVGDCYLPPPLVLAGPDDRLDSDMIRALTDDDIDMYVDGHNAPRSRDEWIALGEGQGESTNGTGGASGQAD